LSRISLTSLTLETITLKLLSFGGSMLPFPTIFLVFLHWDLCIWIQVIGWKIYSSISVQLKHLHSSGEAKFFRAEWSFSPLEWNCCSVITHTLNMLKVTRLILNITESEEN
jgi:hypothetical protein